MEYIFPGAVVLLLSALPAALLITGRARQYEPHTPPVRVTEQHLHLHYHAAGAVVRNGERPAALIVHEPEAR